MAEQPTRSRPTMKIHYLITSLESGKHPLHQHRIVLQEQFNQVHRRCFIATEMNHKVIQIAKAFWLLTGIFRHRSTAAIRIIWS